MSYTSAACLAWALAFLALTRASAEPAPHAESKAEKWVFLGDSLTAGYGVSKAEAFPTLLKTRFPKVELVNASVSGSTSASAPGRVKWVARGKPTLIVIALGANDARRGVPPETVEAALQSAIALAKKSGAKVALLGMRAPFNLGPAYRKAFDAVYPRLAERHELPLLPFFLQGVALEPELNQDDLIHPNPKGHRIIAERVGAFLETSFPGGRTR